MNMRYRTLFVLSAFFLLPFAAFAQPAIDGVPDTNPFTVSVDPQYPAPNGTATLSFVSSSFDTAAASMKVFVNGKQTYSGSVQTVPVTLNGSGELLSVVVKITANGTTYSRSLQLQPESVSLIAEPVSSAPPLYVGKSLVPLNGDTRVVAMANFKNAQGAYLDPTTLSYTWTVDGTRISNSSGIGKSAVLVASPLQYRSRLVSVVVTNTSGSLVGGDTLTLTPNQPSVRLYQNDPLLGIRFDAALTGSYTIPSTEATLYAAPFSFATTNGAPTLQWFLNSTAAQAGNGITLRPNGTGQGKAALSLTASSESGAEAIGSLSILFGGQTSTNLFGL